MLVGDHNWRRSWGQQEGQPAHSLHKPKRRPGGKQRSGVERVDPAVPSVLFAKYGECPDVAPAIALGNVMPAIDRLKWVKKRSKVAFPVGCADASLIQINIP